jgi:NADH-quinone oxidoreductase subunit J
MELNLPVIIILLAGLVGSALLCVLLNDLLKASIAMAVLSAVLAVIMFALDADLAAALELSVCAGLITVVFVSAISMTRMRTEEENKARAKDRRKRFVLLPVILIVALCAALFIFWPELNHFILKIEPEAVGDIDSVSETLWEKRLVDLLGQVVIVLAGVFGILIFFKEDKEKK